MKKAIAVLAVLLLLGGTSVRAAEYPTDVQYRAEDGIREIRKTYALPAGSEPSAEVRQGFTLDGFVYTLTDILRREHTQKQSREETETVTVQSASRELDDVLPLLSQTKAAETDDGFSGTLALDVSSVSVKPAGYKSSAWTVTATRTYPNLSDMDLQYIPKTTSENGRTLQFASIDWQTERTQSVDNTELGERYTAVVTYTGTASGSSVTGYTVTAQYSGTVEKSVPGDTEYVAVFHGTPVVPEKAAFDWRYAAVPAGLLLALCAAGTAMSKRKKKGTKNHEEIQDAEYEQLSAYGENTQPDAADGGDPVSYPGIGT